MDDNQPNLNTQIYLTAEGLEKLKEEFRQLLEEKRPRVVERLAYARSMGDLSENNDYISAKEELEFLDGRIAELESVIKNAIVIENKTQSKEVVLGAKVKVSINGNESIFHIVGEWEADPKNQKISHGSPLGKALLGKKIGEEVTVDAPIGKVVYKILDIE